MAEIIDGKEIAAGVHAAVHAAVLQMKARGAAPTLAVTIVGDDPASHSYIRAKKKACAAVGIDTFDTHFDSAVSDKELLHHIDTLNDDAGVDGILVQLPLPAHIDDERVLRRIAPAKDVDGFHPYNLGLLTLGVPRVEPCTPKGIVHMLCACGVPLTGARVVIVGRSNIVGKPLALMLVRKAQQGNATVTLCHSATKDIAQHTRQADILIAAMGVPHAITADMIKEGATVIDVGVNRVEDARAPKGYRLCGDVDFEAASAVAGKITPVPGGVGPMTIAMLLHNTVEAARGRESTEHANETSAVKHARL